MDTNPASRTRLALSPDGLGKGRRAPGYGHDLDEGERVFAANPGAHTSMGITKETPLPDSKINANISPTL